MLLDHEEGDKETKLKGEVEIQHLNSPEVTVSDPKNKGKIGNKE